MIEEEVKNQKKAYICGISAVLIWSTVASAFKITLRYFTFTEMLFWASLTSVVILFIILLLQKKVHLVFRYKRKEYARSLVLGFLNPFLYYLVLFKAYSLLRAQEALTLNYTWAIMLVVLSIPLLGQRIGLRSVLAIIISFFGAFIIATEGRISGLHFTNLTGVALALGSSLIWAVFWVYNIRDERDLVAKLFLNFSFGFIPILIFATLFCPPSMTISGFYGAIYIGLFEMGVTFILWLKALQLSETTARVANLIYLSPFLSLVFISYLVGEKILVSSIIGLLLIVTGIIVQKRSKT